MAAKIKGEALDTLREAVTALDTEEHRTLYRNGGFPRADTVKDLDRRYRWDLLWCASRAGTVNVGYFYDIGANDAHIDTALRSIVPAL